MIKIPEHISNLPRFSSAKLTKKDAIECIALDSNESYRTTFSSLIEEHLDLYATANRYPDSNCTELRQLLSIDVAGDINNVIVGNGSEGILSYIFKAFCEKEDELLTSNGTFVGIYILAKSFNIRCSKVPLTYDYEFDLELILQAISTNTKVIYISNPNNPTGSFINPHKLEDFLKRVPEHIIVILDEAYYEYATVLCKEYKDFNYLVYKNLITLRTFSKAFGLASIRLGYGFASQALIDALMRVKLTFEPSGLTQHIGILAKSNAFLIDNIVNETTSHLPIYYALFTKLNIRFKESFANFIMIDLESSNTAKAIHAALLTRNIKTSYLAPFGLSTCLRITMGSQQENEAFCCEFSMIYSALATDNALAEAAVE